MKAKDVELIGKNISGITIGELRNPELFGELVKLNVLLGDILVTIRTPREGYNLVDKETRNRFMFRKNRRRQLKNA